MSHSPFVLYDYLTDENGEYVLDESGDKIIISSTSIVDESGPWRRIGGVVRRDIKYVRSFQVQKRYRDGSNVWLLKVNLHQLVGIYPTQQAALQVLMGLITRLGASDTHTLSSTISHMLSKGDTSYIDSDANVPSMVLEDPNYVVTVESVDPSVIPGSSFLYYGVQYSDTSGAWLTPELAYLKQVTAGVEGTQTELFLNAYGNQVEDTYARAVVVEITSAFAINLISASSVRFLKNEFALVPVIDFSVDIGQAVLLGTAEAHITENSTDGTPTYTYEWFRSTNVVTGVTLTNEG